MSQFKCSPCEKTFCSKTSLARHTLHIHSRGKRFKCKYCSKTFSREDIRSSHIRTQHTGKTPYKCEYCGKCCNSNYQLKQHTSIHTGVKPYKCEICGKSFGYKQQFRDHKNRHDGIRPLRCHLCEKTFVCDSELKTHLNYHYGRKPYKCDICQKRFSQHCHWRAHLRTYTGDKPFKCDLCPQAFSQSSHLQTHKSFHTGAKPYECSLCKEKFRLPHTLKSHMRRHTGERPYKCHLCQKAFTQPTPLKHHIQTVHGNDSFSCKTCGKSFPSLVQVKVHSKIHCQAKRFFCVFCDKGFPKYSVLGKHIRTHTREKPIVCNNCGEWHAGNHSKSACQRGSSPLPEITWEVIPKSPLPSPPHAPLQQRNSYSLKPEAVEPTRTMKIDKPPPLFVNLGKDKRMSLVDPTQLCDDNKNSEERKKKIFQCQVCKKIMKHQNHLNGHMGVHKKKKKKGGSSSRRRSQRRRQPQKESKSNNKVPKDDSILYNLLQDKDDVEIEYATAEDKIMPRPIPIPIIIPTEVSRKSRSPSPPELELRIESVRHIPVEELSKMKNMFRPFQCEHCNKMYRTKEEMERHMGIHGVTMTKAKEPEVEVMSPEIFKESSVVLENGRKKKEDLVKIQTDTKVEAKSRTEEEASMEPPSILEIFDEFEEIDEKDVDEIEEEEIDAEMPILEKVDKSPLYHSIRKRKRHSSSDSSLPPILFDETGTNIDPLQEDQLQVEADEENPMNIENWGRSEVKEPEEIEVIDVSSSPPDPSKPFQCVICQRNFGNKEVLAVHQKTHLVREREIMAQDQQQVVNLQKRYKCILCNYVTFSSSELNFHARLVHYGGNSHKCAFCWKSFRSRESLKEHEQKAHYSVGETVTAT